MMRGLVTRLLMMFVFTRPTLPVAFVSLFTPLLGEFFLTCILLQHSQCIIVFCIVVWMFANDGDVIRRDKFLHFYRLRKSKDPGYYEFKPWDRAFRFPQLSIVSSKLEAKFLFCLQKWMGVRPQRGPGQSPQVFSQLGSSCVQCIFLVFQLLFHE